MTQAHHIKYLYEVENKSLNSISKETGFDFRTVKKYVEKQDWNEKQTRNRPSKIESVKEIIDGILIQDMKYPRKQRHTAVRIYQRLLEEYPDRLQVKERTVRRYGSNSGSKTHEVGQKKNNELGLYDMSGNVWEWCSDWYRDYSSSAQTNPHNSTAGSYRVYRGGSWLNCATYTRVAFRSYYSPTDAYSGLGLRISRTVP